MDVLPYDLVLRATPTKQRRPLRFQPIEKTPFCLGDEQRRGTQQHGFAGQRDRLGDDAVVGGQFAVKAPRVAFDIVFIHSRGDHAVQRIFGQGDEFIPVVHPSPFQPTHHDTRR